MKEEELLLLLYLRRKRKQRRMWVHPINNLRPVFGEFNHLMHDLRADDKKFVNYYRMSQEKFDRLVNLITPILAKKNLNFRQTIPTDQRLAICLRFLATGASYSTLSYSFRLGISTISLIVYEVCTAIWNVLNSSELKMPSKHEWLQISAKFEEKWNFPNCVGSIDGKHVRVKCPPRSGSLYYNYKGFYSLVLLAVVDAEYRFISVEIGSFGSNSDGGIFAASQFGKNLEGNNLDLPEDKVIENSPEIGAMPHVFIADEAFPLKRNIMRPFPGRNLDNASTIFNYRLSRARRVVENAFGILAARFRVFHTCMGILPAHATKVVQACVVLHNYLKVSADDMPEIENDPPCPLRDLQRRALGNRAPNMAAQVRNKFKGHFNGAGAVDWQNERAYILRN